MREDTQHRLEDAGILTDLRGPPLESMFASPPDRRTFVFSLPDAHYGLTLEILYHKLGCCAIFWNMLTLTLVRLRHPVRGTYATEMQPAHSRTLSCAARLPPHGHSDTPL